MTNTPKKQSKKKAAKPELTTFRWVMSNIFGLARRFGALLVWAIVIIYAVHAGAGVLIAFTGQTTIADLALRIAANINVALTISLATTGVTGTLYIREIEDIANPASGSLGELRS